MSKIKVMNLITGMWDGGAQRIVLNYLKDLSNDDKIDFKLIVLTNRNDKYYADRVIKENNYNVQYLNATQNIIKIPHIRGVINKNIEKRALKKAINQYKPDIIHVHISGILENTLTTILNCNVPIKFDTLHSNPNRYKGKTLKVIKRAFQNEGFIPICLNEEQMKQAKECYGIEKYEIVHNGIDIENIKKQMISKIDARKMYNIPSDAFLIIGVGRLDKIKNFDLLIDTFKSISNENDKALLIIAGEGKEREHLEDKINKLNLEEKVKLIGNQDNIIPLYCASDMLGITSISESTSLVLLEAQVCELSCVISNGVPDESIVTDKVRKMNKNASIKEWAEALQNSHYKGKSICKLEDYELHSSSKRIKDLYIKYWKEYNNATK